MLQNKTKHRHVFSKGVHLLVDRMSENERVLTFFANDGRLFFAIPMGARTCIGTTDTPERVPTKHISDADRDFILDNINARLHPRCHIRREDVIAERCGVRPLVASANDAGAGRLDADVTQTRD